MTDWGSLQAEDVVRDLRDFANRAEALSERGDIRHPWPTLRILGRRNRERLWQAYLAYFIDPSKPHGFHGELLEEFLEVIVDKTMFNQELLHPDWDLIDVETEAAGDEGRPDIVLSQANRWFVCIELKVDAEYDAGQLEKYLDASTFDALNVEEYDSEKRFYLYVDTARPDSFPPSTDSQHSFSLVTWDEIVEAIDVVTASPNGHRPVRSIEQLRDFRDLISNKTDMNQDDQTYRKLKNEYIEHRDAIHAADEAGKEFVAQNLAHDWVAAISTGEYRPASWDEDWGIHYKETKDSPSWGQIYRKSWKQDGEMELDVHFEHKPKWEHFREGNFVFNLEIEGKTAANDAIKHCWNENRSVIKEIMPETMQFQSPSPRNKYMLQCKSDAYQYSPGEPDAYFEMVQQAVEDNEPIADLLDTVIAELPFNDTSTPDLRALFEE